MMKNYSFKSCKPLIQWFLVISLFLLVGSLFSASILFVQSPLAKLHSEPNSSSKSTVLSKGASLTQIGSNGMFFRVRSDNGEGYVMKLFVSQIPKGQKVDVGLAVDKSTAVKARSRASSFTETAAARGLTQSQKMRTRGKADEYDFDSVKWLEQISISQEQMQKFENE